MPDPLGPRSSRLYVRLAPAKVAWLKYVLEASGRPAFPTVVDKASALVRLLYPPEREADLEAVLAQAEGVETVARFREIPPPLRVAGRRWRC